LVAISLQPGLVPKVSPKNPRIIAIATTISQRFGIAALREVQSGW
jgi:hypothetical protein